MKYFSCQPDSHNGFGLLLNHTLIYFTVERTKQKSSVDNSDHNNTTCDVDCTTEMKIQSVVTLPHDFGRAPECFGMANKSLYGCDLAFVGSSSGVVAVLVMSTHAVLYAPQRSPAALRKLHRDAATAPSFSTTNNNNNNTSSSNSNNNNNNSYGMSPAGLKLPVHPTSPLFLPHASTLGSSGSIPFTSQRQFAEMDLAVGTITWMRDKPLVFVGFYSGRVEWYHVTITAAKQEELAAAKATPASTTENPSTGAKNISERNSGGTVPVVSENLVTTAVNDSHAFSHTICLHSGFHKHDASQKIYENGDGDGIRVRLHLTCNFPETGAFLTSDWFPANGYVVAGAERAVYIFSTEQPETPLCCLSRVGCGFLACHPFLPFVGCLSFGRSATMADVTPDACVLHVLECTTSNTSTTNHILRPAAERRILEAIPRHGAYYSCSWKFSFDLQIAVCNVKEGIVHLLHLAKTTEEELLMLETTPREPISAQTLTAIPDPTPPLFSTSISTASAVAVAAGSNGVVGVPTPHPLYTYTRERELFLPLHSLVNIEFISAATHALPDLGPLTSSSSSSSPSSTNVTQKNNHDNKNTTTTTTTTNNRRSNSLLSIRRGSNNVLTRENVLAERMLHSTATCNKARYGCKNEIHAPSTTGTTSQEKVVENGVHAYNAAYRDAVSLGAGPFSRIVGVNCAGEVTSIPVDADATLTTLRPGCFALGLCSSVFLVPTTTTTTNNNNNNTNTTLSDDAMDMEQRMKRRLAAGFGIPAATNVQALQTMNDPSESDLRVLFAYISIMEKVGVVGSSGPVPSIVDLLSLENAPSTAQLMDLKLLPHNAAVVCRSSTSRNDSRRLLLLHLLDWLPSQESFPRASNINSNSSTNGNGNAISEMNCDMVERAVAVEVLYNRRSRAAALLQHYQQLNPIYLVIAGFLSQHDGTSSALRDCAVEVRESFIRPLSPWLRVAFLDEDDRRKIYTNTALPFWDRVAIAVLLEYDTPTLVSLLRNTFRQECNMVQQLLLEGIHEATCPLMQTIVDCTGDFQLAACLFARIVPQTQSLVAHPNTYSDSKNIVSSRNVIPTSGVYYVETNISSNSTIKDSHPHRASLSWKMWADAYRRFLDNEQEFVKRTMFDLACQQLHGTHVIPRSSSIQQQHQHQHHQQHEREEKKETYSSVLKRVQHNEPALNPLLHLLVSTDQRRCTVCSEPVYIKRLCARESFAWCTACLHGGHADHLQRWFETHSKCPVYGCGCRCEQGGNIS